MDLTKIIEEEYPEMKDVHQNNLQHTKGVYELVRIYELWIDEIRDKKHLSSTYLKTEDNHDLVLLFHGLMLGSTVEYTAEDITNFSVQLTTYERKEGFEKTGIFLSQLIYGDYMKNAGKSQNKTYKLILSNLQKDLNLLGYANQGNLYILGHVNENLGIGNQGTIFIEGDVNGEIYPYQRVYVEGNVRRVKEDFTIESGNIVISGIVKKSYREYNLEKKIKIDPSLVKQKKIELLQT